MGTTYKYKTNKKILPSLSFLLPVINGYRNGIGTDQHKYALTEKELKEGCLFKLGGVKIPNIKVLSNSDGDVVYHALWDAISSAIGGSSIGKTYPKDNRSSDVFLKELKEIMDEQGYAINNISIVIECTKPKILPIEEEMKKNIAEIFKINLDQIGITAKSGEGLTEFGKGKGVEAIVNVSLFRY
ncbi:2-C-methyl-D-erythritol 2,4-cyclodiphosphate synthase [Candidatus Micrarchaeota archaeon]|nr:2-C-methyl-D-erythritol 2,4-cyclodiphosphate synthase [Candidatus Micrarchaeota archaeon]